MPAACSVAHHRLELQHLLAALAAGGVGVVRGEEADRVVAPVVRQAALDQVVVLDELVHRHQLDRGDAELRAGGRSIAGCAMPAYVPRISSGMSGCGHRQALDVRLVDDRLVVRRARVPVVLPVEERVDDDRLRHVRRAVGWC